MRILKPYKSLWIIFSILAITAMCFGQWPLILQGPLEVGLLGPVITDNQGILYCIAYTTGERDLWACRVDSGPTVVWQQRYVLPNRQYSLCIGNRSAGGCVVLVDEFSSAPPNQLEQLKLVGIDENGTMAWQTVVRDTILSSMYTKLVVSNDVACATWLDGEDGRVGYNLIQTDSGVSLTNGPRYLCPAFADDIATSGDSFYIAAADSAYLINRNGEILNCWSFEVIAEIGIASTPNGLYVLGCRSNYEVILQRLDEDSNIVIPIGMANDSPVDLQLTYNTQRLIAVYSRRGNLYYRTLDFETGDLIEEDTLCFTDYYEGMLSLAKTDSAVIAVWWQNNTPCRIYLQQFLEDGSLRWPEAVQLGTISNSVPWPLMGACSGGAYGWTWWANNLQIYIHPGTVPDNQATDPNPLSVRDFHINTVYPNPFNCAIHIEYTVTSAEPVQLDIYNVLGQHIATLADARRTPGSYQTTWTPRVGAGIYFIRLQSTHKSVTQRILYMP